MAPPARGRRRWRASNVDVALAIAFFGTTAWNSVTSSGVDQWAKGAFAGTFRESVARGRPSSSLPLRRIASCSSKACVHGRSQRRGSRGAPVLQQRAEKSCENARPSSSKVDSLSAIMNAGNGLVLLGACAMLTFAASPTLAADRNLVETQKMETMSKVARAQAERARFLAAPPELTPEERIRRQTTPSPQLAGEEWFENAKGFYVAKCSTCHPAGMTITEATKSLEWGDMRRNGVKDVEDIREILRYGKGKMPGFAVDCKETVGPERCKSVAPLPEYAFQVLEDFVISRANENWKGRLGY